MDELIENAVDELLQEAEEGWVELDEVSETDEVEEAVHDTIRPNSNTALIQENTSRFSGAEWFTKVKEQDIILAGLGGIGSYVAFLLGRMQVNQLYLYDGDIVERANMSGQLYDINSIGLRKSEAIGRMLYNYSSFARLNSMGMFKASSPTSNIMICGFDNMRARQLFFHKWMSHVTCSSEEDKKKCLFIDGRLAAEEFQVIAMRGDDEYHMRKYSDEWLFSDEEAEQLPCSYKQTSHCANMIASVMVNIFTNFIANQCEPLVDRDVPFLTTYDASTMYFKTVS